MAVSKNSIPTAGQRLIERLDRFCGVCTNRLNYEDYNYTRGDVEQIQAHLRNAVYRLRFLEMCVLGLTQDELNSARIKGELAKHAQCSPVDFFNVINQGKGEALCL
jgi:hypothetical protein